MTTSEGTTTAEEITTATVEKTTTEEMTTSEVINGRPTTFESSPEQMTTEYPNEEIRTEQPEFLNEEEFSTVVEDPVGFTPVTSSTEPEEDFVFPTETPSEERTTNEPSTEDTTAIEDESIDVTTQEQAIADLQPTPFQDEASNNIEDEIEMSEETTEGIPSSTVADLATTEEAVTMGSTSQAQPDTTETVEEETTDANSVEPYSTEGIPEQYEFTSEEEVVNQELFEEDTETTAIAFEEAPTTTEEVFTEAFEAETVSVTPKENEGEHSTSEEEISTIAAGLLTNPVEDDPEGAFQDETTPDKITKDEMMDQANIQDTLPEEETTRNNQEITEERDEVTEASSNVIMTHTYVMKERENSSSIETGDKSTKIPVDVQPETKSDAAVPNLLDLVNQNFNEADNIISDTKEIVPLKAPKDGIQEERTFYRTEKSISKVVTEISV